MQHNPYFFFFVCSTANHERDEEKRNYLALALVISGSLSTG